MTTPITLPPNHIHLWQVFLPDFLPQLPSLTPLLNPEETARAQRFKFDIHRNRYIITRALLRKTLATYLSCDAAEIHFTKGEHGKPYLQDNPTQLQFNVSHSHDAAIFAFAHHAEIGVDIEKMEEEFDEAVAERFFSLDEYAQLKALPSAQKNEAFYRFWSGKEAVIKALGKGLYAPLKEFSLQLIHNPQNITVAQHTFHLEHFAAFKDYQSAFAVQQRVEQITRWAWNASGQHLMSPGE